MEVHEGAEILARLGILESKEESPSRKKEDSFVDVKFDDDSDSNSNDEVVFDRNALMSSRSRRRGSRRSRAACCIFAESSIFALVIICCALFTTGFTLNSSPNVNNLIGSPSFSTHFLVQTAGMLTGALLGRRLVGMISFTSVITVSLILGLGCTLALLSAKGVPVITVLFMRSVSSMMVQYCSVSLVLAFWRGHRRKLVMLFVCFTLGAMLAPKTASERADSVVKRETAANKSTDFIPDQSLNGPSNKDSAHALWDWSGEATLRGGEEGTIANWLSVVVTTVSLLLFALTYLASCSCGVAVDARVHRLREVEEFTPLSIGFRIRIATLQIILGAAFTLCEWSRVVAGERREALAVEMLVFLVALVAGDTLLSLSGLSVLLFLGTGTALLSLLAILPSITHAGLFSVSALSLIYLPLLIDMRVTPRPLLTVDLLVVYPIVSRLVLPLALLSSLPLGLVVFVLCSIGLAMIVPLTRSLHKAERVLISGVADQPDPKVMSHRPLTKNDYSALLNAIDEESDEESSV
ncbi:hypothetical protein PFISCL1PPCAC_17271 [Pristionchus fissidentatus]|uniref:Uncharacterized protein n=1 Tax=Pristionchus fissidentatus TaxID=1538716 RepID=A0AAV5W7Y0_9BILA|nr:hypothetical protein PFISCL1PPCAC_17271 [Pristionchus fissidentatus]